MRQLNLQEFARNLKGLRVLFKYDSSYLIRLLIISHFLPKIPRENLYLVIFSDIMHRRFEKTFESLPDDLKRELNDAKIIKVGTNSESLFGEVVSLVDFQSWDVKLSKILSDLSNDDLLLFHGFSLAFSIYEDGFERFVKVANEMPYSVTVLNKYPDIGDSCGWLLERLHDVVVSVKRDEYMEFEESFSITVEQSIVMNIKPSFARVRLDGDKVVQL